MKKLFAAVLLCAATAAAQVGTISTGGLGGPGSFGARGFGGPAHVFVPRVAPVAPLGPCCGPSVAVSFGHDPRVGIRLGGFGRRHVFSGGGVLWPFGWDGWWPEESIAPVVVESAPSPLPRQITAHYEEHVPAAPLIIELQGDRWVRRRVVEAEPLRAGQSATAFSDVGDQLQPTPSAIPDKAAPKKAPHRAAQRTRTAHPKS